MKQKITTHELIYYTGEETGFRNFDGETDAMPQELRLHYLDCFQRQAREWYQDQDLARQAASREEAETFLRAMGAAPPPKVRRIIAFDTMEAALAKKTPRYTNLQVYGQALAMEHEIAFQDPPEGPTPCAEYRLPTPQKRLTVSFEVLVPSSYRGTQTVRRGVSCGARCIELRCGTLHKVKLKLYQTGEIMALCHGMWSSKGVVLGHIPFDRYISFRLEIGETLDVTCDGKQTRSVPLTCTGAVDSIFFDGGMFPRDGWRVRNLKIDGEDIAFQKQEQRECSWEPVGEVALPYAVGTETNKDKRIYLEKTFVVGAFEEAYLHLEALDPCGKVWLNGKLVLDAKNFQAQRICVSRGLKTGENRLNILVEPRAPEVYYAWHRHTDCYNGWFCGKVWLELTAKTHIERIEVSTAETQPSVQAELRLTVNRPFHGTVQVYAGLCHPWQEDEQLVAEQQVNGTACTVPLEGGFRLWDTQTPCLYSVRACLVEDGTPVDDLVIETGFRTIRQKHGRIYLNGKRVMLNGALLMQFLPPLEQVPVNHNCAADWQIAWQALMLKKMNGNILRMHLLGYGTNDRRYAEVCDRMGIMLIWTTRYIDSLESIVCAGTWRQKRAYQKQMRAVMNHPSIVMWEGSNEFHAESHAEVDKMYCEFVAAVKEVDTTRLICPCSHLYYGGGIYDQFRCAYYNDSGSMDQDGNPACAAKEWNDPLVVRSAHTYDLLCGYGTDWDTMCRQEWRWQRELLESRAHSYLITEFAITGLANPNTPEALSAPYIESYERGSEVTAIGRWFTQQEWALSQAHQALCAFQAVKKMRLLGVDGMLWCSLMSGANNGSYLKPPIDFYGYRKLAFYTLRDAFKQVYACQETCSVSMGNKDAICPVILTAGFTGRAVLTVCVWDEAGRTIDKKRYAPVQIGEEDTAVRVPPFTPNWEEKGFYTICFELEKEEGLNR